ncbi:hypothetical protein NECAME_12301 [Necator americanus]|uniref:Uncharacterized protein n=1 Tax=Necator americanus TaxID=51031 RepID=W2T0N5_NECAM|nr:hypothetical protein NECAME_12301 [Necator americanus]ETN75570.1 hypothetical protein NECAME_12301 [Necator americanus]
MCRKIFKNSNILESFEASLMGTSLLCQEFFEFDGFGAVLEAISFYPTISGLPLRPVVDESSNKMLLQAETP